jgi:hypothetical protein
MSSALQLFPGSVNFLTSRLVSSQLMENQIPVTLAESGVDADVIPKILDDGMCGARIFGSLTITESSPTADMEICRLPFNITPLNDSIIPVVVMRGSTLIQNAVSILNGGSGIEGITVTAPGSYATLPSLSIVGNGSGASFSPIMEVGSISAINTAQSGVGSYAPDDIIELAGGTFTARGSIKVTNTKVVSATIAAGGSGGTDGAQTVTGTTGTGTKFQAAVTITGGEITAVNSISVAGDYTVNPTLLTAEPVTGASLTGATLNIVMGVSQVSVEEAGAYTVLPSNPVSQFSTTGAGTGAQVTPLWGLEGANVLTPGTGYDGDSALSITGGGGTGGGAATLDLQAANKGKISLVTAPQENDVVHLDNVSFVYKAYGY